MLSNRPGQPLLEMRGISKSFPGVKALGGVDITLRRGEVLALMGENGAGKSTLIKILGGAQLPDAGSIHVDGTNVILASPLDAIRHGIGIIYQEFNLIPELPVWENIFLGREKRLGFKRRSDERRKTIDLFEKIGVHVSPDALCGQLSVAQQQIVEIAKALSQDAKMILMDEPSAALTQSEVERLFVIVNELKAQGIGIIYVSHRLEEIFEIADRAVVLRDGIHAGENKIADLSRESLIEMMVGRDINDEFPKVKHNLGETILSVRNLNSRSNHHGNGVQGVSFDVRRGEILGITGLIGAGRTEVARLIFAADEKLSGDIKVHQEKVNFKSPRDAISAGVCLLTEDRKHQGLVLISSVLDNFTLPNYDRFSSLGFVHSSQTRAAFGKYVQQLRIKIPNDQQPASNLSGGNQQKVVLAKWLQQKSDIIIFDEPTRGIDVGAKYDIYQLMNELTESGKAVIMISSELPEVLGMSDRILVMHEGRITGTIDDVETATQEQVMELAVG